MIHEMVQRTAHPARSETMKRPTHTHLFSQFTALALVSLLAAPAFAAIVRIDSIAATAKCDFTPDTTRFSQPPFQAADSTHTHNLNIADCKAISTVQNCARVEFNWTWQDKATQAPLNFTPTYGIKISAPGQSCDVNNMVETNTTGCQVYIQNHAFSNPLTTSGELTDIDFKQILGVYGADPGGANCNADVEADAQIYFILPSGSSVGGTTSGWLGTSMNVHLDLAPPATPTMNAPAPGNANLHVSWSQNDTTDTTVGARVYWSDSPFTPDIASAQANHSDTLTATSYQITGLTNGTTYWVSVTAVDPNGNESGGAPVATAIPVITYDLWNSYQAAGGQEQGGFSPCSARPTGNAGPLALLMLGAVLLLLMARRRRVKLRFALHLVVALLVIAPLSLTAEGQASSPQTASIDLRVASYKPGIDNAFVGHTPYADVMKDSDFTFGINIDWRVWHSFGELGVGFGIGRWSHQGTSLLADGSASNDTTNMTIIPLTLDAVYRFDILAQRYEFPIVPYVRAGFVYGLWWMTDAVNNVSAYTTPAGKTLKAIGGTGGLEGTFGIRLLLDVFEPGAARSFDIEMGVNHSYIFAEVQKLWLNDFGSSKSIDLSDTVLAFGLAFDL